MMTCFWDWGLEMIPFFLLLLLVDEELRPFDVNKYPSNALW